MSTPSGFSKNPLIAIVTPEVNINPATIEKNSIPFVFVFTAKIYIAMLYLIPINMKKYHSSFKSPVILSIFSSGAGPRDIQVVVPGEICV